MIIYVLYVLGDEPYALGCSTSRQAVEAEKKAVINRYKKNLNRIPNVWIESHQVNNSFCEFCE